MIGILTFFDYINYGTYLQAYALHNYLLQKGYDNEFINYRTRKNRKNEYDLVLKKDSKGNILLFLRILTKIIKFRLYHKRFKKTRRLYTREQLAAIHYNTIIVGSDQIWCYTKEWAGLETPYFSDQLQAKKLITYAASMGPDKYDQQHPRSISRLMKNFHHISVRDTNTFHFARMLNPNQPQMVLDPTFLYDFSKECKKIKLRNYILFYSDGPVPSPEVVESVKKLACEHNLQIVSIGKKYDWCDRNFITPSPFGYIGYIKNANFVITCMYHGLMFSVKYKKQFAMFLIPERENKSLDFLNRIGLSQRVIQNGEMAIKLYNTPIEYSPVEKFLEKEKKISEDFLMNMLENSDKKPLTP